jgi:hypothetical protein
MNILDDEKPLTRRDLLQRIGIGLVGAALAPRQALATANLAKTVSKQPPNSARSIYGELLQTWCDGLLSSQVTSIANPGLSGGLLCPACGLIHGRCGDAVYPLLRVAHSTGDSKYIHAALLVHEWSEKQVSRPDGSWVNDVTLSSWKGITVFHAIALAEALQHHNSVLDETIRRKWTDRLARAVKFLDGFMNIETGNINYPVTSSFCFALCGHVLGDSHYLDRARELAHTTLDYFTPEGLLFGEGHPLKLVSAKHCRPVDLGYNVEESLPSLAMYALLTDDKAVLDQVVAALRTHMEFMLPDGAWDNSWGTRNYKWTWWGSRTSDGCHAAYVLLAPHEPRFLEVARRNLELMAACTHDGLLYGGPHYFTHGDLPCVHHTFTHAKALATVLDRASTILEPRQKTGLPRDEPYGLKTFHEIGTFLAAIGPWRATITEYDWEYTEHVQAGGSSAGGHVSGGALSLLFHRELGPVLVASMTAYQQIEISNQQVHGAYPHMELTPRIECVFEGNTYLSVTDFEATLSANAGSDEITFEARGRLLTATRQPLQDSQYYCRYRLSPAKFEIVARASVGAAPLRLVLPVISQHNERVERISPQLIRVDKETGYLGIRTDTAHTFSGNVSGRTFNLVPGFECLPLEIALRAGEEVHVEFTKEISELRT